MNYDLFSQPVYERPANTWENRLIAEKNATHLNNQCQIVLDALKRGERLTTASALLKYGIGDCRARIRDLAKAGYPIQKKLLEGRYKEYYME